MRIKTVNERCTESRVENDSTRTTQRLTEVQTSVGSRKLSLLRTCVTKSQTLTQQICNIHASRATPTRTRQVLAQASWTQITGLICRVWLVLEPQILTAFKSSVAPDLCVGIGESRKRQTLSTQVEIGQNRLKIAGLCMRKFSQCMESSIFSSTSVTLLRGQTLF